MINYQIRPNGIIATEKNVFVGEVITVKLKEDHYNIMKVFVRDSYRGQGIAAKLLEKLVNDARKNKYTLTPVCSYAVNFFNKNPNFADVLVN